MSDFDKYIRQSEPDSREKAQAWQTAIGLQDVDGLKPSEYLLQTAGRHIEGDITIDEVKHLLDSYYQSKTIRENIENDRTEEADKVSARITEMLSEKSFSFTPDYLILIHKRLFEGLYKFAGKLRDYDITKKEWVLNGASVLYSNHELIRQTLDHDFNQEKTVDYPSLNASQALKHLCKFVSDIWQVHPFGEGNTRTTAVFTMKYLRTFGFEFDNNGTVVPGTYAEVYLLGAERDNVVTLPLSAIVEEEGTHSVFVKEEEEHYEKRSVALGESDGTRVEIKSGVKAGETVVVEGAVYVKLAANTGVIPEGHHHH